MFVLYVLMEDEELRFEKQRVNVYFITGIEKIKNFINFPLNVHIFLNQ